MHRKNIRQIVTKQLKYDHPHWKKMTKKSKKELVKQIMDEVVNNYDYSQILDLPIEQLTGTENQTPSGGIRTLSEMAEYIEDFYSANLFNFDKIRKPYPEIVDQELIFIDELFDDPIINSLISQEDYSPQHREIHPYQLFRMEILKIIKYPEISYRKFCSDEYFGKERKQNRRFLRLPLNTNDQVHHTELCHFRKDLTFKHLMNVLVYINPVVLRILSCMELTQLSCLLKLIILYVQSRSKAKRYEFIPIPTVIVGNAAIKEISPIMLSDTVYIH